MNRPTTDRGGIQQAIRALQGDGWLLFGVHDGEDSVATPTEAEALAAITAVDEARLFVTRRDAEGNAEGGTVLFVLGNSPEEVVCNYTVNLEVLDRLTSGWI